MPIRMNRGRAAVYRKLWAWPLRSPRHLIGAFVGVVVVATAIGLVMPKATNHRGDAALRTGPTATRTAGGISSQPGGAVQPPSTGQPTSTSAVPRVTTVPPSSAPPAPEAIAIAEAWARAWVHHPPGMTNEQWVAQLAPLTTEEFLPQLHSVDPANIPSTAVVGKAEAVTASARAVDVTVTTDGAKLLLTVIATDVGWRVSAFNRAD